MVIITNKGPGKSEEPKTLFSQIAPDDVGVFFDLFVTGPPEIDRPGKGLRPHEDTTVAIILSGIVSPLKSSISGVLHGKKIGHWYRR